MSGFKLCPCQVSNCAPLAGRNFYWGYNQAHLSSRDWVLSGALTFFCGCHLAPNMILSRFHIVHTSNSYRAPYMKLFVLITWVRMIVGQKNDIPKITFGSCIYVQILDESGISPLNYYRLG